MFKEKIIYIYIERERENDVDRVREKKVKHAKTGQQSKWGRWSIQSLMNWIDLRVEEWGVTRNQPTK